MPDPDPRLIDMFPDGRFRSTGLPPGGPFGPSPLAGRVFRLAVIVAVVAGLLAAAFLAFWFALAMIPVAFIAGLVAWASLRFQTWRARRAAGGSVRRF
jgi:hypothetical protein